MTRSPNNVMPTEVGTQTAIGKCGVAVWLDPGLRRDDGVGSAGWSLNNVMPTEVGTHDKFRRDGCLRQAPICREEVFCCALPWIPAYAGMTVERAADGVTAPAEHI